MSLSSYDERAKALQEAHTREVLEAEEQCRKALSEPPVNAAGVARMNGSARGGEPGNVGDRLLAYMYMWRDRDAQRELEMKLNEIAERYGRAAKELDDEFYGSIS